MTAYILGGCAIAILIGIFTKSWMTGRDGAAGIGPLGVEVCFGGVCQSLGWANADGDVQLIGYLALLAGLAAAGACGWMAFLTLTNSPNKFPAFKIINGALGAGAGGTVLFLVRLLIDGKELSISWSPIFGIGGVIAGGIFVRKLRPYWPGQGNMPWPVAVASRPMGQLPPGQPYGQQPYGAPPQQPFGAPPQQPFGAPPQQPFGAPPQQPFGAPMGAPPSGPPIGAAPMGAPPSGPPMGAAPMGPPPMGAPPSGPPMNAPGAPMSAPMGPPMGSPPGAPYGAPAGAAPSPYGRQVGEPMNAPPAPQPAPMQFVTNNPPPPGGPRGPLEGAPLGTAPTMAAPGAPIGTAPTMAAPGAPQNKATILGAPAPQLAAILKQQQAAQPAGAASAAGAPQPVAGAAPAAQAQFCPRCGKPMTFVAQYQRWFCQGCQQYA